ncbi:OmpA family protein [Mucilaginibacter terrae]|uniref:OmpA family protein n=1 Tax=Mucilaginibacter terrae TaxID=1955052 RepID=UPI00363447DF
MKISKIHLISFIMLLGITFQACKTKKIVAKPTEPVQPAKPTAPVEAKPVTPTPVIVEPAPVAPKPDFNFTSIQFEFNSAVLKTDSYAMMDKIATEMKKDASAKFVINGHSSAEGSAEHNQSLSEDRANSVKLYLTNAGINAANLSVKGYGESKPVTNNTSEESRALNRRVEIKLN